MADLALDGGRAVGVVGGAVASSVAATVEFCEGTNTDVFAEVDVSCNGSYFLSKGFKNKHKGDQDSRW